MNTGLNRAAPVADDPHVAADLPKTVEQWDQSINQALQTPDPVLSNFRITRLHYLLSRALLDAIGPEAGANFHSWAVWGSRKAGITIRQEDKDQASRDATVVAGIVGALVGVGAGWLFAGASGWSPALSLVVWMLIGTGTGGFCGFLLARYTRRSASRLILEGNRIVLDDIGRLTARYLAYVEQARNADADGAFAAFITQLRDGPTERGGQTLLRTAFEQYEMARRSTDLKVQHECNYFANCLAVLHEHVRLQPYISRSLPFLIRKCVTQRLMTYSVGQVTLAVHEDVPPLDQAAFPPTLATLSNAPLNDFLHGTDGWDVARGTLRNTRTKDWTKIRERMGYIVNLFRTRHLEADVVAPPYTPRQFAAVVEGRLPERPW